MTDLGSKNKPKTEGAKQKEIKELYNELIRKKIASRSPNIA